MFGYKVKSAASRDLYDVNLGLKHKKLIKREYEWSDYNNV
jgi:hypothetical protein